MEPSDQVRDAYVRFAERLSAGDVAAFDDLVSTNPATSIQGTAPGEFVTSREQLRFGFETEGLRLVPKDPRAWVEGTVGWCFDQPDFVLPDGTAWLIRLTSIFHEQDGAWKLVHGHFSIGVPDEETTELQARWGT